MTVCVAALCDGGKDYVLASDQMVTAHFPIGYEFESEEVEKICEIIDNIYVLVAGDVLFAHLVFDGAKNQLATIKDILVETTAQKVRESYQNVRRTRIIQSELETRGLNLNSYYQNQKQLIPQIVTMIDQAFKTVDPNVELLIAGQDKTGCHIFSVHNPGIALCHDPIGFAAVGSGAPHAIYSLIGSEYKKSMSSAEVIKIVSLAKKRSEVAPGVGEKTTIVPDESGGENA